MTTLAFRTLTALFASTFLAAAAMAEDAPRLMLAPTDDHEHADHEHELELPKMGFYSQFITGRGAYVTGVMMHSEAAKLGLEEGDIIVGVNGRKLKTKHDWHNILHDVVHHHDEEHLLHAQQSGELKLQLQPKLKPQHEDILTLHIRDWRTGQIAIRKTNLKNWD